MKEREPHGTRWGHKLLQFSPPISLPLPKRSRIIYSSQIDPYNPRTSSLVTWWPLTARSLARNSAICISSIPPLLLYPPSSSCKLLDICNPRFIAHSYHSKWVFSTRIPSDSLFLSALRPTDVNRRARLIGDDRRTEVPPRHHESVPGLSRCSHLSRKIVSANSYKRVHYCVINVNWSFTWRGKRDQLSVQENKVQYKYSIIKRGKEKKKRWIAKVSLPVHCWIS